MTTRDLESRLGYLSALAGAMTYDERDEYHFLRAVLKKRRDNFIDKYAKV